MTISVVDPDEPAPGLLPPPPQCFEAGTAYIGDELGLGAAIDYVEALADSSAETRGIRLESDGSVGLQQPSASGFHPARALVENGYIEGFKGRLRNECLNVEVFFTLADASRKLQHLATRLQPSPSPFGVG